MSVFTNDIGKMTKIQMWVEAKDMKDMYENKIAELTKAVEHHSQRGDRAFQMREGLDYVVSRLEHDFLTAMEHVADECSGHANTTRRLALRMLYLKAKGIKDIAEEKIKKFSL